MLKLNISGLQKKWQELWTSFWVPVRNYFKPEQSSKQLEKNSLFLEPVKIFFEDYIGIVITGFDSFSDRVQNIDSEVRAKIITQVLTTDHELVLMLSTISGKYAGYITITPSMTGRFIEADNSNLEPGTRYRLKFFGEDYIEYADGDSNGLIAFNKKKGSA